MLKKTDSKEIWANAESADAKKWSSDIFQNFEDDMWLYALAALATSFNLNCSVGTVSGPLTADLLKPLLEKKVATESKIYRIDLPRMRWCEGKCILTRPLVELNAADIVLYREQLSNGNAELKLSREGGGITFVQIDRTTMFSVISMGECKIEPFDGMPEPKF